MHVRKNRFTHAYTHASTREERPRGPAVGRERAVCGPWPSHGHPARRHGGRAGGAAARARTRHWRCRRPATASSCERRQLPRAKTALLPERSLRFLLLASRRVWAAPTSDASDASSEPAASLSVASSADAPQGRGWGKVAGAGKGGPRRAARGSGGGVSSGKVGRARPAIRPVRGLHGCCTSPARGPPPPPGG